MLPRSSIFPALTAAVLGLGLYAPTFALAEPGPSDKDRTERLMEVVVELTMIENKLTENKDKALASPKVVAEQARVQEFLLSEMGKIEPKTGSIVARIREIDPLVQAAQEGTPEHHDLILEASILMAQLETIEQRTLQEPAVKAAVAAFDEVVYEAIGEVQPEFAPLVERRRELLNKRDRLEKPQDP